MCRPFYLWVRFFFADNFIYDATKMRTRAIMMSIPLLQILTIETIFFRALEGEERSVIRWIMYPVFTLLSLCYYRASYAQPFMIPQYNIQTLPQDQVWQGCKNWRPERAAHWIMCNKCILKHGFHHPCLANCIGYHNEKFAFLYMFYTLIMNFVYIDASVRYSSEHEKDVGVFFVFMIAYWVLNIFSYLFTFFTFMSTLSFFLAFWNNVSMSGKLYSVVILFRKDEWQPNILTLLPRWSFQ